ncbi:hypothetical protein HN865_03910 [Candidatus Woesearchaeota archaeon]|jgi:hypothetical protein|nr:hypothetical protein [Candidatus Woesearchaeota archaeon]MBT7237978.1 hypothetical protein [Candidatus Woesearchaeota archaeon]
MEERTPLDLVDYTDGDLENSLRNVFVDKNAEYIVCDGDTNRSKFLSDGINLGVNNGWLMGEKIIEDQCTTIEYRLTPKGKEYFGLD